MGLKIGLNRKWPGEWNQPAIMSAVTARLSLIGLIGTDDKD